MAMIPIAENQCQHILVADRMNNPVDETREESECEPWFFPKSLLAKNPLKIIISKIPQFWLQVCRLGESRPIKSFQGHTNEVSLSFD